MPEEEGRLRQSEEKPVTAKPFFAGWVKGTWLAAFIAFTLWRLAGTVADPDLWGFLAFGRLFWTRPGFPYQDIFSFVPTLNPWVYHEWLTGVLFYPLYQATGAAGLQLLKFTVALATMFLCYLTAIRRGAHPLAALFLLTVLVPGLKASYSPVRAQIFTYLFFAWFLCLLEQSRRDGRFARLWPLPPLMVLWGNLHGGFLAGLGLIFLYGLGEALGRRPWRPYAVVLLLAVLATLVNPYGLAYWPYLFRAVTMPRPMVLEWISLFQEAATGAMGRAIFTAGVLLLGVLFVWRARWREPVPALVLGVTLVLGLKHVRHLTFFFLAVAAYLPVTLEYYRRDLEARAGFQALVARPRTRASLALAGAAVALIFLTAFCRQQPLSLATPAVPPPAGSARMYYPMGAADHLERTGAAGRVLVDFGWGEYLMWRFHPRLLVAIDGRFETVYPEEVVQDYLRFYYAAPGWSQFLDRYRPDLILIKNRGKLPALLLAHPHWQVLYSDEGCLLFRRRPAPQDSPAALPLPAR